MFRTNIVISLSAFCSILVSAGVVELFGYSLSFSEEGNYIGSQSTLTTLFLLWFSSYLIPLVILAYSLRISLLPRPKYEALVIVIISYASIIMIFSGVYYSMSSIGDLFDASIKYAYYNFSYKYSDEKLIEELHVFPDTRSFRGIEERMWSGPDWEAPYVKEGIGGWYHSELTPKEMAYNTDKPFQDIVRFLPSNRIYVYISCLYLSVVTMATVGYGDIVPNTWYAKIAVMTQTLSGLVLFVIALGMVYSDWWGGSQQGRERADGPTSSNKKPNSSEPPTSQARSKESRKRKRGS